MVIESSPPSFPLLSHLHEKGPEPWLYQLWMVITHVILQLVTARELLSAGGTSVRGLCHAVQGAAQLAPALPCVHHLLDLQEAVGHLEGEGGDGEGHGVKGQERCGGWGG